MEKRYTCNEVAELYGITADTVRANYEAGLLPGQDVRRPGSSRKQLRFTDEDLAEWRRRREPTKRDIVRRKRRAAIKRQYV